MPPEPTGPVPRQSEPDVAFDEAMRMVADLQMGMRIIHELLDDGPGNAAQLAERLTEKDDDGDVFTEEWVDHGLAVLDQWSLLSYQSLEPDAAVELWS